MGLVIDITKNGETACFCGMQKTNYLLQVMV